MKKGDIAVFAGLLILAAFLWWAFSAPPPDGSAVTVVIQSGGEKVFEAPLAGTDTEWSNGHNRVVIKDGKVRMEWSDCANQICVHAGSISQAGQQIVCLPNRVIVRLEAVNAGLDGMTY